MAKSEGMTGKKHSQISKEKIKESMTNNSNAEYWTKDLVIDNIVAMLQYATTEYEIVVKKTNEENPIGEKNTLHKVTRKPHLKSSLLINQGIWSANWFSDMRNKFKDDETVLGLLKCIDMVCEHNIYEDSANNATNANMAKSLLSRYYDWVDKTESKHDHTTGGEKINGITPIQWVDGTDK